MACGAHRLARTQQIENEKGNQIFSPSIKFQIELYGGVREYSCARASLDVLQICVSGTLHSPIQTRERFDICMCAEKPAMISLCCRMSTYVLGLECLVLYIIYSIYSYNIKYSTSTVCWSRIRPCWGHSRVLP